MSDSEKDGQQALLAAKATLLDPSTWSVGWVCVVVPNAAMLYGHYKGKTLHIVNAVLRTTGVYGLFAVP